MKIDVSYLEQNLKHGMIALREYGFFEIDVEGIAVRAEQGACISIERSEKEIKIVYDTEPHFYMALARAIAAEEGIYTIQPKIEKQIDMDGGLSQ